MRLDRLITLHIVRPLLELRRSSKPRLPVLMYHSISGDPETGRSPYYKVCTAPRHFAEQMCWLADHGYRGVTLESGLSWLKSPTPASDRQPVVITFDDGFQDFYTAAFPILQRHRFSATMYLPTIFIGEETRQFQSRDCLTWSEVHELFKAGVEFGSHTVNHRKLVEMDWPEIEEELRESKAAIERRIGTDVRSFAYPYAFPQARKDFVAGFQQTLRDVGYTSCTTTEVGRIKAGDSLLALKRLPMNGADDPPLLRAKLEGAYDWLAIPQAGAKSARQLFRSKSDRHPSDLAGTLAS